MIKPETLGDYLDLVDGRAPFLDGRTPLSQANYGDGEWLSITGRGRGAQCDGQSYTPEAAKLLLLTLTQPRPYWYGGRETEEHHVAGIRFCKEKGHRIGGVRWIDRDILHRAEKAGEAGPWLAALRRRRVMIVGPAHLRGFDLVPAVGFVEVPSRDAFNAIDRLEREIRAEAVRCRPEMILFSAAFAAKVLIWRLWPTLGQTTSLFDVGSGFDGFCGSLSRGYHRRPTWPPLRDRMARDAVTLAPAPAASMP